jgi:Lon protease-like protein
LHSNPSGGSLSSSGALFSKRVSGSNGSTTWDDDALCPEAHAFLGTSWVPYNVMAVCGGDPETCGRCDRFPQRDKHDRREAEGVMTESTLHFMQHDDDASRLTDIPEELPILPLRNTVVYPFLVLPLNLTVPRAVALIEAALHGDRLIGLVAMKDSTVKEQMPEQLFKTGTVAKVGHAFRTPDNAFQVVVQGIERFRIEAWGETSPYLQARITLAPDTVDADMETEALQRSLRDLTQEVLELLPRIPQKMRDFLGQVEDPRYLAYLVAANARLDIPELRCGKVDIEILSCIGAGSTGAMLS